MQHKKDEYIFQLVTRAVKEIDSSEICRKREIFKILAKSEVSLEMKQIIAKSARVISELQHYTEEAYNVSQYILCLLYTSPSPRDGLLSRMPSSA